MKIDTRNPRHLILLLQQGIYTVIAIAARYLSRKPQKPVVVLYGHQLSGNLKALYEEWQRNHRKQFDCYFLSMDPAYCRLLQQHGVPVLQCNKLGDMLLVGRCDSIITDHGLHTMSLLITFTSILFVDVWHGIPFKGFVPEDFRLQQRYDEVWVSSPLLKELYQDKFGFRPEIVHAIGYARVDKLFSRQAADPLFREQASIPAGHKIVLYAPTWQQDDQGRELFPFGESQQAFLQQLNDVCRKHSAMLVIRSHLNASISTKIFDNVRYCSMKEFPDTEGLLLETDILICDWSSIVFDFLALNRPTIFLDVEPPFKNGFSLGREYRFGKVASDMDALCDILGRTLENPDGYTRSQRVTHEEITAAVYGENTDGNTAYKQWLRLNNLITRKRA
jgi:CDP-glycerol glycerophosphotransferase (TagB/SpsB family)